MPIAQASRTTSVLRAAASLALLALVPVLASCNILAWPVMTAYETGSHSVAPQYTGLANKNFAVIVAADRAIQSDHPDIVVLLTREISRRLAESAGAAGIYPADEVLRYQFQHPGWVAASPGDIAKDLGVDRLVFVDLTEFTLTDPGNPYVWNGAATASIGVLEAESGASSEFAYKEAVHVTFPDKEGVSPLEMPRDTVKAELALRFVHRASWLFFQHDEQNTIKY